ncbi:MAG: extracellular solute-binding protein [Limnochordaceae bacterium]|nr:extracellular solute-binding protein [Limnochordaceae bacterium]
MVASRTPSPSVSGKLLSWSRRPAGMFQSTEPSPQSTQLPAVPGHKAHGPAVRKAARSALTAVFVLAVAAVSAPSGSLVAEYLGATGAAAAGPITLRFSEYPRPFENDLLKELIPLFEKQNPDLKLVYEPITDPVKMTVNMAGGTAPDVVCWWSEESASMVLREVVPALNQAMQAQKKGAAADRK